MNIFNIIVTAIVLVNQTLSPDGKFEAFTSDDNNLYVREVKSGNVKRLTDDGSDLVLNGYASWVYYEEIFGRPSNYKAFWWSPDSKKIAFYRFDNSEVPMFPIYSPFGKSGSISETRYPKAGDRNPSVRIGIIDLNDDGNTIWADFSDDSEQYFGTPFWGDDSKNLFVQWMPRVQQQIALFAVCAFNGKKTAIYEESYSTWVNWVDDMLFGKDGLYMVRDYETGWQQIYYLSYDGKTFHRFSDGHNWRISLRKLNEKTGEVYFTAYRDSDVRNCLYVLDRKGRIKLLSDSSLNVEQVQIADDFRSFQIQCSSLNSPLETYKYNLTRRGWTHTVEKAVVKIDSDYYEQSLKYDLVYLTLENGIKVPAIVSLPKDFDPSKRYPLVMEIYGGPDTPYVRDRWRGYRKRDIWYYRNGIIKVIADSRAAGHNGRADIDLVYRDLLTVPIADFVSWANYFASLPYVDSSRIGVEGFSFGGTMTAMLVMTHPECFKCGIAGGGVYDWELYDTHYTERFMDTPDRNPDGYAKSKVLNYVSLYDDKSSVLKITHGTGDDNVHFQNTLLLVNELQIKNKQFDLMIYPDGMHGYRGAQAEHDMASDAAFWTEHLLKQ